MGVVVEALDAIYSILKGFDVVILMPTGGWSGLFMAWYVASRSATRFLPSYETGCVLLFLR